MSDVYKIVEALKGRLRAVDISKLTKKALSAVFGHKNVSVRLDRGTAYGWVEATIYIDRPENCECNNPDAPKLPWGICFRCRDAIEKARELAYEATRGIPFYTYYSDMGEERKEFIVSVRFKE